MERHREWKGRLKGTPRLRGFVAGLLALVLALPGVTRAMQTDSTMQGEPTAVLGFQVENLSASAAEALANVVRHVVSTNGRMVLIDRDRTEAVLSEQNLALAGCTDIGCMVEAGKLLGARRVITGSINTLGRKYMIEVRSADVATARIEALETAEYRGEVEGLTEPVERISKRLVARLVNEPGILAINTEPNNSAVEIDGEAVGLAPIRLKRPGGVDYKITATRFGYEDRSTTVHLAEKDSIHVMLRLDRAKEERRYYHRTASARLFVSGGFPLNQASSNLDTRISWGQGESVGAMLQFGTDWRLTFGGYSYSGVIDDVEQSVLTDFGASKNPDSEAGVLYSSLVMMLGNEDFAPFISGGVSVMERTITQFMEDGSRDKMSSDYEIGWLASIGLEIGITRFLSAQVEAIHTHTLATDMSWYKGTDDPPDAWVRSFDTFKSFTVFRLNVGLKL